MNVVNTPPLPSSGFRLFYDEVVADVRAALRERLGKEKVPIADVQREVARLWKECSNQEEYRQKAALLRESHGTTESSKPLDTDELVIPPHRLRRIIELDDNGPGVSKGALKVLGQATTIFLSQFAGNIHRQIVDTEGSYPVKPVHVCKFPWK
uniref:Uncharacterized protein n=1 Tax=Babesia bovis TaxID=5865 RepID=S6C8J1_BABBO|nr:hypothetical protein [Babesia bovis]